MVVCRYVFGDLSKVYPASHSVTAGIGSSHLMILNWMNGKNG